MDLDAGTGPDQLDEDDTWGHPSTLGVTALVLAVLSLFGTQVLRGSVYTLPFSPHDNGLGEITGTQDYRIAGAFLTAAFALGPMLLAKAGLRRLVPSDGTWSGHLLRSAYLLGTISLVLHTVQALLALKLNDEGLLQLIP